MSIRKLLGGRLLPACLWVVLIFLSACSWEGSKNGIVLADFEHDADLDALQWSCRTLYSLSDEHVTHGLKSLKLDIYPSDYPGLIFPPTVKDWRGYRELSFDIFYPSDATASISVRIDDRKRYPDFGDRFNGRFVMKRGANHIVIPLSMLITSNTGRNLDLSGIERIFIFVVAPQVKTILYVDAVSLQ